MNLCIPQTHNIYWAFEMHIKIQKSHDCFKMQIVLVIYMKMKFMQLYCYTYNLEAFHLALFYLYDPFHLWVSLTASGHMILFKFFYAAICK